MSAIAERVQAVRHAVVQAAVSCGRKPEEILLVAAAKQNDAEAVRQAIRAGVDAVGENRVQELLAKYAEGAYAGAPLHFIGRLQRNKVRQIVGKVDLIHSVDSVPLLEEIALCASKSGTIQNILLEVNIGNEPSKTGFLPEEIPAAVGQALRWETVRVRGLMCIPPPCDNNLQFFLRLQQLYVDIRDKTRDNIPMDILSMGMSADFRDAIAAGATMIRVGQAIFGSRSHHP